MDYSNFLVFVEEFSTLFFVSITLFFLFCTFNLKSPTLRYIMIPLVVLVGTWGMFHEYKELTKPILQRPSFSNVYTYNAHKVNVDFKTGNRFIILWLSHEDGNEVLFQYPYTKQDKRNLDENAKAMKGKLVKFSQVRKGKKELDYMEMKPDKLKLTNPPEKNQD